MTGYGAEEHVKELCVMCCNVREGKNAKGTQGVCHEGTKSFKLKANSNRALSEDRWSCKGVDFIILKKGVNSALKILAIKPPFLSSRCSDLS